MFKQFLFMFVLTLSATPSLLRSHCQMPCGIFYDGVVFDQVDQYIETMVKAINVLQNNEFKTIQDRNTFVRWVIQKENNTNEIANLITTYFLQQKIKPGQENTVDRLVSAHMLLSYLVQIKQSVNGEAVNHFYEEWEKFKEFFPVNGYKSAVDQKKLNKMVQDIEKVKNDQNEMDHDHSHGDHHSH